MTIAYHPDENGGPIRIPGEGGEPGESMEETIKKITWLEEIRPHLLGSGLPALTRRKRGDDEK